MFAIHTRLVLVMNDNITCRLSSRSFSPFNGRIHQKGFWFSCFNFLKRIIFNECDEGRMVCFRKYKSYQSSHLMIVHRLLIHYPFHRFNNIIRQYFVSQQWASLYFLVQDYNILCFESLIPADLRQSLVHHVSSTT